MSETHKISFRERIRLNLIASMEKANINQVQLAEKLGISKGTVNNWARGNNSPDVDMVPRICDVLGISVLDLYAPTKFEDQEAFTTKNSSDTGESARMESQTDIDHLRTVLLQNYNQLNQEGRERLVETSDDMVSSGKYIKSNPDKLGSEKSA